MKKEFRIKKNSEILSLMKKRKSVGNNYFVIYYNRVQDQSHLRYAISIPKKFGNAVQRNQMKRRIREILRNNSIVPDVDFFVIVKAKAQILDFGTIKINMEALLKKAKILKDGNYEK